MSKVEEENLLDEELEIKRKTVDLLQFFKDKDKFLKLKETEFSKLLMNNYFMYPFVERHPVLREAWKKNHKKIARYDIDFNDIMMNKKMEKKTINRFEEKIKIPYIKKKLEEYDQIQFIKKGLVYHLQEFDVNSKNEDAIKKTKLFGEILNEISDENDLKQNELNPDDMDDSLLYDEAENEKQKFSIYPKKTDFSVTNVFETQKDNLPVPGKIYFEELTRMFYLNNNDPETYNIAFFSEYFDIDPKMLRNAIKCISVPFEDKRVSKIVKILRFIDL